MKHTSKLPLVFLGMSLLALLIAPAFAKKRPPLTPIANLRVLRVISNGDQPLVLRALIIKEETSHALAVEMIARGQTEGDPDTLVFQADVNTPASEARRITSLRWSGKTLHFNLGNVNKMTHNCRVQLPSPAQNRHDGSYRSSNKRLSLKPDCVIARGGQRGKTRPGKR